MSQMSTNFSPYFEREWQPTSIDRVAYVQVRVTTEPRANGSVTVFLADGTALNLHGNDLLPFDSCSVTDRGV